MWLTSNLVHPIIYFSYGMYNWPTRPAEVQDPMELRRIRYFLTVARTLNFSQAARELKISQPALSKAIQQLESEFGGSLIRREGRLTHLTRLGERMRTSLQEVEDAASRAAQLASRIAKTETACIRIAIMCTIDPGKVGRCLAQFQQDNPTLSIELLDFTAATIQEALLNGKVDVAIIGSPVEAVPRVRTHELFQERMVMSCGLQNRLAQRESIPLKMIAEFPYIDRLRCEFRDMILSMVDKNDVNLNVVASSEREDWIKSLLAQDHGISIMPESSASSAGLKSVALRDQNLLRSVYLTIPAGREDLPPVQALIKHVKSFY
ncbi:transcriptional regulator, LysR family [Epibacterium ulvae]|uniref:Transcriptional regulator, LysR family n=2 Tax=Epibacterium ulvae TaxID=1156985 RepID=A0A1G5R3P9_9RHOB|nr:transcriptional regulator, LysR family [Epibacterium ulvae]